MKKLVYIICLFFVFSCDEEPVIIPDFVAPTSDRVILIEEFTGANCGPCPAGAAEIDDLLATFPNNLIAVSIHSGSLDSPLPESVHDFRSDLGESIYQASGAIGTPMATVGRIIFEGETSEAVFRPWQTYVNDALETTPFTQVKIDLVNDVNFDSRELSIDVTVEPQVNLSGDIRLGIMIIQKSIIDAQNVNGVTQLDYNHKHVLLDMLTDINGDNIANSLSSTDVFETTFNYQIPEEFEGKWKIEGMQVVAFVSAITDNSREILQAHEEALAE
jgi:hypothetical protein